MERIPSLGVLPFFNYNGFCKRYESRNGKRPVRNGFGRIDVYAV